MDPGDRERELVLGPELVHYVLGALLELHKPAEGALRPMRLVDQLTADDEHLVAVRGELLLDRLGLAHVGGSLVHELSVLTGGLGLERRPHLTNLLEHLSQPCFYHAHGGA